MTFLSSLQSNLSMVGLILGAMGIVALFEVLSPLHAREPRHRAHLLPNLTLTFITFAPTSS